MFTRFRNYLLGFDPATLITRCNDLGQQVAELQSENEALRDEYKDLTEEMQSKVSEEDIENIVEEAINHCNTLEDHENRLDQIEETDLQELIEQAEKAVNDAEEASETTNQFLEIVETFAEATLKLAKGETVDTDELQEIYNQI